MLDRPMVPKRDNIPVSVLETVLLFHPAIQVITVLEVFDQSTSFAVAETINDILSLLSLVFAL